jgi:hypothetical protein
MGWNNKKENCLLCDMKKRTKWYEETENFVVADNLSGSPFIIIKDHKEEIEEEESEAAHNLVEEIFGDHEFKVRMNLVKHHWHAHITTDKIEYDLSNE